ncbi:MAG: enoyl-CoA hydratase/isomerase family protein [Gammaproteobacteria bacterium]|nr:enoyl-CoA hydratase/isomerase family protein [Gammaproteobacteria bacterium]
MTNPAALVSSEIRNRVGHITLNRPAAYNAINLDMTLLLLEQLRAWQQDNQVLAVVLRATGDKAFCAGGDIRELYDNHRAGSPRAMEFFHQEYILDQLIHDYARPVLALGEGLVLGGGMGLFQGASLRVITENARLGMPETGIGYFPDVGGSYFLSRLAGQIGSWLAVSGTLLDAADALHAGLADWLIPSGQLSRLDQQLDNMAWSEQPDADLRQLLEQLCTPATGSASLAALQPAIDRHFAFDQIGQILDSLASEQHPDYADWAQHTLATLNSRSPMAMVMALAMQRRARTLPLPQCFAMELQAIHQWFEQGDFIEGVRAVIVDKDKNPQWKYREVAQVPAAEINAMLAGF